MANSFSGTMVEQINKDVIILETSTKPEYLLNLPTDIVNDYGLSKTLLTRRETIYLKHILKNVFIYGNEKELLDKLSVLQFKSIFQYIGFITNKLRGIYKAPRDYKVGDADVLVQQKRDNFIKMLELYRTLKPIVILDFDKTITNKKFHSLYEYISSNGYQIIINSANPSKETIVNYLNKHGLPQPRQIYANKGKQKKIVKLKEIASKNFKRIVFYIDDENEYLEYGCLLCMYCYEYTKDGRIRNHTIFKR